MIAPTIRKLALRARLERRNIDAVPSKPEVQRVLHRTHYFHVTMRHV